MKRCNIMKVMIIMVVLVLFSIQGWATPIPLPSSGDPANAGDDTIQTWLKACIDLYNAVNDPNLSKDSVGAHPDIKVNYIGGPAGIPPSGPPPGYPTFPQGTLGITLPGNLNDYLVLHWGGPPDVRHDYAYDLTTYPEEWDTFISPTQPNGKQYGLSFYSFYGDDPPAQVHEPATMFLLGSGLIGLAGYGRKKFFKK